mmetsp:Transcript_25304/g.45119  ORF Transcript_25304/g.45119 Transcript_25304/m.45119 type:complete len:451 (-) Transcript_25304:137-1489(-)|eukprot:CAMPEP_0177762558 /NCGR_PEP_ID=MMETSP0491_2-20121128/6409_1 /TAXON_ID=63592 /ORGANISM="Tetraselmis chuii, Strain PLY429" /LENGTH=450 /DNA_ID=CAMNT_0019278621 /DNA_START=259 /DNA_END=1611 /DNA_ORIENTATION=+
MASSKALTSLKAGEAPLTRSDSDNSGVTLKSSQFKGVHWDKTKAKWVGYIHVHGKKHHLGYFAQEEDAARAYDRESLRCRGITKNFPSSEYDPSELNQDPEPRKALEKSSRYIGVSWNKLRRKWAARIIVDGRSLHLGHYVQEVDAARAYDKVCLKSRGTTKNFATEEYTGYSTARKPQFSGHPMAAGKFLPNQVPHPSFPVVHSRGSVGDRSSPEQNSDDSSTCAAPNKGLHDLQPRLFMNSRELGGLPSAASEGFGMLHSVPPPSQSGFNPYTAGFSPTKSSAISAPNWSQPSMIGAAPSQFMGYSAGFNSLLPMGPVSHTQHAQPTGQELPGSSAFFFPQSNQGTALHTSAPYNTLQPVMPSSLLAGQPLQLPTMLQMHSGSTTAAPGQIPPGNHQIAPPAGMAQLQAWAAIQNSMYAAPSTSMYSTEKQMDVNPPLKRPRFDTFVQ